MCWPIRAMPFPLRICSHPIRPWAQQVEAKVPGPGSPRSGPRDRRDLRPFPAYSSPTNGPISRRLPAWSGAYAHPAVHCPVSAGYRLADRNWWYPRRQRRAVLTAIDMTAGRAEHPDAFRPIAAGEVTHRFRMWLSMRPLQRSADSALANRTGQAPVRKAFRAGRGSFWTAGGDAMANNPGLRACDVDRERTAAALREHLAAGRLTVNE